MAPHNDARRGVDQHQRPARQGAADQGRRRRQLRHPEGQPVPRGLGQDAAGDLRDGLPEPVPDPGRLRRRRLRDRLLAGLARARARCAVRPARAAWRSCASRPTTAGRCATAPDLPMYMWDFNTQTTFGEPFECGDRDQGPANTSRWNTGLRHGPPITQPDIWYSYNDNATPPLGTPCLAYYDGSRRHLPAALPGARDRRRRPARRGQVRVRPGQPERDQVPAVLRRGGLLRRVHARLPARDPARLQGRRPQDQQRAQLRRLRSRRAACSSATTRWTCSSGRTAASTC